MWHQSAPRAPVRFNLTRWVLCFKACINLISPTGCSVLWFFIIKMSTEVLQRLSTIALSTKHLRRLPHLSDFLPFSLPPPSPTVTASQVPSLFREPYILSGYRPVQQDWRCYLLSLFRKHNESLNVWTHLLASPVLLLHWWANVDTLGCTLDDVTSLPLLLFLVSSLTYLYLSVAAHLRTRTLLLLLLGLRGCGLYQYGCSLGHYFYASEPAWRERVGVIFLPGAAFFGWLSCTGCCYAKFRYRRPYPPQRKVCQLIPTGLVYVLDISPVAHRLLTVSWSQEPSLPFHALQIACFLLSALFFSCPIPERFFPGNCDFAGQGHQIFHVLLSLCTLSQLEALFQDYARRRDTVVELFGERQLWWACVSFPVLFVCCILTTLIAMRHMSKALQSKDEWERNEEKSKSKS